MPEADECLTSYLQRIAKSNYATPHDIWRFLSHEEAHYPQSSMSSQIDISPKNFLDIEKLLTMLITKIGNIEDLTFTTAYRKVGVPVTSISHSRILSAILEQSRKFCPECLEENLSYKLIWQVKEVEYCPVHNTKLQSKCNNCSTSISIMPSNSEIGICPNCNFNLKESISDSYIPTTKDFRIIEDWSYLLNPKSCNVKPVSTLTIEQSLAIRLLYLVDSYNNELTKNEKIKLSSIMQIARNSKSNQTFMHLSTIFHFTRRFSSNLQHYLDLEIPNEYINSFLSNKTRMIDNYTCIAPWCSHYNTPGSLKRTPTSVKVLKTGAKQKYYMYCIGCGLEYSISENNNSLIERGDFISFAWNTVKNSLSANYKFTELAKTIGVPQDKLRRAIILLATNNLITSDIIPLILPYSYDPAILEQIKKYIKTGTSAKAIRKYINLNYNDFLFYWLSCEIRLTKIKYIHKRPDKRHNMDERVKLFENAINQLVAENIPITIASVCKKLDIVPETLRYWGFLGKLKEFKAQQKKNNDIQFEENIVKKTEKILFDALSRGEKISSENLYKILGVRRNVLVRRFPHLTQFINSKLTAINKLLY
jgi:DNA-binding transcriptional MerR regulator